jgi:hypothetical protein
MKNLHELTNKIKVYGDGDNGKIWFPLTWMLTRQLQFIFFICETAKNYRVVWN